MTKDEMQQLIRDAVDESCSVKKQVAAELSDKIVEAAELIAGAIRSGGKVLVCGNGGSAADAQHFAAEFVGRYCSDRAPYPAVALTTDSSVLTCTANDYGYEDVFERQTLALGRSGDVLVAITTSGNSPNVVKAAEAARKLGMKTVSLTGAGGGALAAMSDVLLAVPSGLTPRIQESHGVIVHLLCELTEKLLA